MDLADRRRADRDRHVGLQRRDRQHAGPRPRPAGWRVGHPAAGRAGQSSSDLIVIRDLIRDELDSLGVAEPDVRVRARPSWSTCPACATRSEALSAVDVSGVVELRPVAATSPTVRLPKRSAHRRDRAPTGSTAAPTTVDRAVRLQASADAACRQRPDRHCASAPLRPTPHRPTPRPTDTAPTDSVPTAQPCRSDRSSIRPRHRLSRAQNCSRAVTDRSCASGPRRAPARCSRTGSAALIADQGWGVCRRPAR